MGKAGGAPFHTTQTNAVEFPGACLPQAGRIPWVSEGCGFRCDIARAVGSVAGAVKSGEPALAPLQKIKFPMANTARASRIPLPIAIRSQLRKRGRDRGSPSMC